MNSVSAGYVLALVVVGLPMILLSARRQRRVQNDVHRIRMLMEKSSDSPSTSSPEEAVQSAVSRLDSELKR